MSSNTHELLASLERGVVALAESDQWRRYLRTQSRFPSYSANNVLLIVEQRPDATRVAGYETWRRLGRQVRRGEQAIRILAPLCGRRSGERDDNQDNPRLVRGFRVVSVFDIAQTEGDELPTACQRLVGADPAGIFTELVQFASTIGFAVEMHRFDSSTNGDCSHDQRLIRVESSNSPAQQIKTLAHELAHALLHESATNRALAELEAESIAYVCCNAVGIDSGAYSYGYLAVWAGGSTQACAAIRTSCARIQKTASAILEALPVQLISLRELAR